MKWVDYEWFFFSGWFLFTQIRLFFGLIKKIVEVND